MKMKMVVSMFVIAMFLMIILLIAKLYKLQIKSKISQRIDSNTGLGNFAYFEHRFVNDIPDALRNMYYVMYIIIDSNYLDVYHRNCKFADVVKHTASVLTDFAKHNEIAARITDNGFAYAFVSNNITEADNIANELIEKLNAYTKNSSKNNRNVFHAAIYNLDLSDRNPEFVLFNLRRNCIKLAETDNQIVFCDEEVMNSVHNEKETIERISRGFENREFKPHLQFIVDNKTKKIVSAEALSRWHHPDEGILAPGKYIEIMGSSGLITEHDFYIFEMVCNQLELWSRKNDFKNISISCNFTRITLSEDSFADRIKEISDKYSFDRSKLIMEITEDAIEIDIKKAKKNISKCRQMGFTIALDDLGSGYTSLANLCDYSIDVVKIDRDILLKTDTQKGKELFEGIIALSRSLNLRVVCEGVETNEQNDFVSASNCDYVQGWYFSKALPIEECEDFVREYTANLSIGA